MQNVLTIITEVDDQDYEIEFTVTFNETHIISIKPDSIHSIERFTEDDVKYIPKTLLDLGPQVYGKLLDHAWRFAKNTHLEEPEREYHLGDDDKHY